MQLFNRLHAIIGHLEAGLIERGQHVRLALLAALAGEHTLLVGPPGTAKSEMSRRLHAVFPGESYFERLLTRFTVPEELFGPLSIQALEEDRYERHTGGFLPEAGIAFIDEIFRANSAILNALLTLLNEREFDNGAGRQRCPLISVVAATNAVPADEVGEAFFDRFLVRVPIERVSDGAFARLLSTDVGREAFTLPAGLALDAADLRALAEAADRVEVPGGIRELLAELRQHCAEQGVFVSDRRWVKVLRLLCMAAASAGRPALVPWDMLLLRWCLGPDAATQAALADWLGARLGVREAFSPPRLTQVVEAFESRLAEESQANELDYDESGRLKFSSRALAESVGDAKGGAGAARMTYSRRRRYGRHHIGARLRQIDDLVTRIGLYLSEIDRQRQGLEDWSGQNLWLDAGGVAPVAANLGATRAAVVALKGRLDAVRAGFVALPRLDADDGLEPEPVDHAPLPDL